jgi:ankyrin repeat protein
VEPELLSIGDTAWKLISSGQTEEAKRLFISDAVGVNERDAEGRNTLHMAALVSNAELADFFLHLGTEVDVVDSEGRTPLNIAQEKNDSAIARLFVYYLANIHHPNKENITPAMKAITDNDIDFLRALLSRSESFVRIEAGTGRTILHLAANAGNVAAVTTILDLSNDQNLEVMLNKDDAGRKTPLDLAFSHRDSIQHAETAELLIKRGAIKSSDPFYQNFALAVRNFNYNIRDNDGIAPLHFAVREGYTGFTYFLLQKRDSNPGSVDPNLNNSVSALPATAPAPYMWPQSAVPAQSADSGKNAPGATPLHEAALRGDIPVIEALLRYGANPNIQDAAGNTPMHLAIPQEVHSEALSLLLAVGRDPNIRNGDGNTPLHQVVSLGRAPAVIQVLLHSGADVALHNNLGQTPLYVAVERRRLPLMKPLLEEGTKIANIFDATNEGLTPFEKLLHDNPILIGYLLTPATIIQTDTNGNTALIVAVRDRASVETVREILDRGAAVNVRNKEGDMALHFAVRQNQRDVGELLVASEADIFAQNSKGESAVRLIFPVSGGAREWMLIPDVLGKADSLGDTVLHFAAQWKLDNMIRLIVSKGADLEKRNTNGETPLFIAVKINSPTTVISLLDAGASLETRDMGGNTALHIAARPPGAPQAAETLINSGINIDAYNLYGKTPLHDAVNQQTGVIESLLLRHHADTEVRDNEGNTPLMDSVIWGHYKSARSLIENGSDVATRNNHGDTPLLFAVTDERSDIVAMLLSGGAQIHAKNADGESPFTVALSFSDRMVYTLLTRERALTPDDEGRSPLHIAVQHAASRIMLDNIIKLGGRISAVDREGRTALRLAIERENYWDAIRYLAASSDVFSADRYGRSSIDIALARGTEAIRALCDNERVIRSRDSSGNTVLHYAARMDDMQIIQLFLTLGADKTARNTAGERPYDIALRWNNRGVAALLQ